MCFFSLLFRCFCQPFIVISIWRVGVILLVMRGHARRKFWFRIFFYGILEPWAPVEKVFFFVFFASFFCKSYVWARTWLVFGSLKTKILISRCFLKAFWSCRYSFSKELLVITCWAPDMVAPFFDGFFKELMGISIRRMTPFFDHSRGKSWFCIVFLSICEPCDFSEQVFLFLLSPFL